jgi:hypothetical protein
MYDNKGQYRTDINKDEVINTVPIIKKFFCTVNYNRDKDINIIILRTYYESPFMGDIEMLMKINNYLESYEKNKLEDDLKYVDEKIRPKMRLNVKMLIYKLLNYTLKLISVISSTIKNATDKDDLKQQLLKYSIGLVYRITQYIQDQMIVINKREMEIKSMLGLNNKLKQLLNLKMDKLLEEIKTIDQKGGYDDCNNSSDSNDDTSDQSKIIGESNENISTVDGELNEVYQVSSDSSSVSPDFNF